MLLQYSCELHHLNPNGIQQLSIFVTLCEGFLVVEPHFGLWKSFFSARLQRRKVGSGEDVMFAPTDIGSVSIQLKLTRSSKYIYASKPSESRMKQVVVLPPQ